MPTVRTTSSRQGGMSHGKKLALSAWTARLARGRDARPRQIRRVHQVREDRLATNRSAAHRRQVARARPPAWGVNSDRAIPHPTAGVRSPWRGAGYRTNSALPPRRWWRSTDSPLTMVCAQLSGPVNLRPDWPPAPRGWPYGHWLRGADPPSGYPSGPTSRPGRSYARRVRSIVAASRHPRAAPSSRATATALV